MSIKLFWYCCVWGGDDSGEHGKQATIFHRFDGWFYCWGGMLKYGATQFNKTILHSRWMATTNRKRSPPNLLQKESQHIHKRRETITQTEIFRVRKSLEHMPYVTWISIVANGWCTHKHTRARKHNWFRLFINRLRWNEVECDMKIQFPSNRAVSFSSSNQFGEFVCSDGNPFLLSLFGFGNFPNAIWLVCLTYMWRCVCASTHYFLHHAIMMKPETNSIKIIL